MATYDTALAAAGYILRLTVTEGTPNVAANTSPITWSLVIIKGSGTGKFTSYTVSWNVNIGGITDSGTLAGYNFASYSTLTLGSGTGTITHNPDGTKTISVSGTFDESDPAPELGDATSSGSLALTNIPRGPKAEHNGAWAQSTLQVEHNGAWVQGLVYAEFNGAWVQAA